MTEFPYTIRNYQPADFNNFVLLYRAAERSEPVGRPDSAQAISEKLTRPDYAPEHDLYVVVMIDNLIGFMDVQPELGIERVIVDCWLQPEHRRKKLGSRLLDYATRRARELGARFLHVNVREDNHVAGTVLSKFGFKRVRRFLELRLDLAGFPRKDLERATRGCRHLQPGEEDRLTQIQNRSFAEHWGYNPNTVATITHHIGQSHRSLADVVLVCDEDKVTGYCWTEITGEAEGRIYMIGSDPDYRGRGLGKKLLLAGLSRLRSQGVNNVWLTVDSENKTARALYSSFGFTVQTGYLWYEKSVD